MLVRLVSTSRFKGTKTNKWLWALPEFHWGKLSYSRYLHSGLQPMYQPLISTPQQNPRSLYQPERESLTMRR